MTEILTLIGDPGGGKSTLGKFFALVFKYIRPDMPRFSNTEVGTETAVRVDDLHMFIAQKLIHKDRSEMFCLDDEAAQAGLESRGSGSKAAAVESRIITHSRKAGAWLILISQLKSMLDKRAQWVESLSILCESVFLEDNNGIVPDYFHYTVYDNALDYMGEFDLDTDTCSKYIWPGMDTYDIPDFDSFKTQCEQYWDIDQAKDRQYDEYMKTAYQYVKMEIPVR